MSGGRPPALRPALLVAALLALLYLPAVSSHVGEGDVAKFQFVGPALGTPHPTGYPLQTLLGHLPAALWPAASWPYLTNLLSALATAAAAGALTWGAGAGLGARPVAAVGGGLLFGLAPAIRAGAAVAEVYPLHLLLVAAALAALLAFLRAGRPRALAVATLISGLALAHHATAVLLAPSLALALLSRPGRRAGGGRARAAIVVVAGLLALLPYLYLVERSYAPDAPYLEARASSAAQLLDTLAGAQFRGNLGRLDLAAIVGERLPWIATRALAGGALLLPLGLLGLLLLARDARRSLAAFLLGSLLFLVLYTVSDLEAYLLAPMVALGLAAAALLERAALAVAGRVNRGVAVGLIGLLPALPALLLFQGGEPEAAAAEREAEARATLGSAPRGSALVVLGYARGMTFEALRLSGAAGGAEGVVVLPREALEAPFLLAPIRRHLEGEAPLRLPPRDRPLAAGAPLLLVGADADDRRRLAASGVESLPWRSAAAWRLAPSPAPPPAPLAFVVSTLRPVVDLPAAAALLRRTDFDPLAVALVAGGGERRVPAAARVARVRVAPDRIEVEIAGEGGWLVFQETLRERWLAFVDGVETPTFRADWAYPALALPPGARRVELVRDARPFSAARWLRGPWGYLRP